MGKSIWVVWVLALMAGCGVQNGGGMFCFGTSPCMTATVNSGNASR